MTHSYQVFQADQVAEAELLAEKVVSILVDKLHSHLQEEFQVLVMTVVLVQVHKVIQLLVAVVAEALVLLAVTQMLYKMLKVQVVTVKLIQ
jgi:hypothetical protein